jgi:hypothetical protein
MYPNLFQYLLSPLLFLVQTVLCIDLWRVTRERVMKHETTPVFGEVFRLAAARLGIRSLDGIGAS